MNKYIKSAYNTSMKLTLILMATIFLSTSCLREQSTTNNIENIYNITQKNKPNDRKEKYINIDLLFTDDRDYTSQTYTQKRKETNNKEIYGFYSNDLNRRYSGIKDIYTRLLIIDGIYHLLIQINDTKIIDNLSIKRKQEKYSTEFILINIETGLVLQYKNKLDLINYLSEKIQPNNKIINIIPLSDIYPAIFIPVPSNITSYCTNRIYQGCYEPFLYDTGYNLNNQKYAFFTSNTSYTINNNDKYLHIGFYQYSNKKHNEGNPISFLPAETLVINSPTKISILNQIYNQTLPADFIGNIQLMWPLDEGRRYLVYFGNKYPFLYLIMDTEHGLNIKENQFKELSFFPYSIVHEKFGYYTNYQLRAIALKSWMDNLNKDK